jgi:predicted GIY-YIG superfamily endonuclease
MVQIPKKKTAQMLRSAEDRLELKIIYVYWIPCDCGEVYVGQSGRTIQARYKEHQR